MEIDFVSLFHVEFSSCAITIHLDSFQKRPGVMVLVSCPENYTHSVENFFYRANKWANSMDKFWQSSEKISWFFIWLTFFIENWLCQFPLKFLSSFCEAWTHNHQRCLEGGFFKKKSKNDNKCIIFVKYSPLMAFWAKIVWTCSVFAFKSTGNCSTYDKKERLNTDFIKKVLKLKFNQNIFTVEIFLYHYCLWTIICPPCF